MSQFEVTVKRGKQTVRYLLVAKDQAAAKAQIEATEATAADQRGDTPGKITRVRKG